MSACEDFLRPPSTIWQPTFIHVAQISQASTQSPGEDRELSYSLRI